MSTYHPTLKHQSDLLCSTLPVRLRQISLYQITTRHGSYNTHTEHAHTIAITAMCIFMITTYKRIHYISSPLSHNVPWLKNHMKRSGGLRIRDGYRGSTVWSVEEPLFGGVDSGLVWVTVEEESSDEGWITESEENVSSSMSLERASTLSVSGGDAPPSRR